MNTPENDRRIADLRRSEVERLSKLPRFPDKPPDEERGTLLSDRIKHYCVTYDLISPFNEDRLRPASYALSVGRNYSIGGVQNALNEGMALKIEPYQVVIVETYETINMPEYLIGRWNIQTKRAYQGLLWVGGAQVDPGFRGYLCCPIYNLSTEPVCLDFRDPLAVIDFVTTTPYRERRCLKFPWDTRKKLVFQEYGDLRSGIEARVNQFESVIDVSKKHVQRQLAEASKQSTDSFRSVTTRIDTFLTLVFTVVAVLFAGLGIVATRVSDPVQFLSSPAWVAGIALYFALWAAMRSPADERWLYHPRGRVKPWVVALVIAAVLVATGQFSDHHRASMSEEKIQQAQHLIDNTQSALTLERLHREQTDATVAALQQQIKTLQDRISPKK